MPDLVRGETQIQGATAHDAADSGNPVKIGGKALDAAPTAVAASDRVDAWFDVLGRMVSLPYTNSPLVARAALTTTTEATLVAAPGAGLSIYVVSMHGSNSGASLSTIGLRDGTGAANDKYNFAMAANGGGFTVNLNVPWKLTANTALFVAQSAAVNSYVTVNYFIAP